MTKFNQVLCVELLVVHEGVVCHVCLQIRPHSVQRGWYPPFLNLPPPLFGPTDFGGWSYRFTAVSWLVSLLVRPLVTSFSRQLIIGFL